MNKQLLVEVRPFDVSREKINESIKENDGRLIVKGVLQRAESKNQNGRVYPREVLLKEVGKYLENQVRERRALGELDHPESAVVNLNNASHNVIEMHWNKDDLVGTVEVLSTPAGNILKELFRSGIKLGISSRGLGSVEPVNETGGEEDTVEVQPDFELIAFDFVSNPSTHGAFMNPVNESVQHQTLENNIERIINSIMRG
jgi:hypothetical protein|tara:strand:- start:483 stop:1085 length:603 start_codon:yes stop_codon:yes gene_type:complete